MTNRAPDPPSPRHSPSVERVARALRDAGVVAEITLTTASARTAQEAAAALQVEVAQIAKSLVFRGARSQRAILVVAAGDNRVDLAKLEACVGEPVERADADFVRAATGFAIGGVAPLGHSQPLEVVCDETLRRFSVVWAAAGSPHAVFPIDPEALFRLVRGIVADVRALP